MHVQEMIGSHPDVQGQLNRVLAQCIEECYDCSQTCLVCADACLGESHVAELRQCIRLNLDCSDVCITTGATASRRTGSNESLIRAMLEACALACGSCAQECDRHAKMHEHCRICAEACRRCEAACRDAIPTVGAGRH